MNWFVVLLAIFGGILFLVSFALLVIEVLPVFMSSTKLIGYRAKVYVETGKYAADLKAKAKKEAALKNCKVETAVENNDDPNKITPLNEILEQVSR